MKKNFLLTTVSLFSFIALNAQSVINNGAFENWMITPYDNPDSWYSSNNEQGFKSITTTKAAGRSGFAIKLETKIEGSDTLFGYFSSTNGDPVAGEGGVPYSQKPDSITGYYKSDIKNGDSALLLVIFKKNGAIVSFDINQITGTQTSFTRFSFPLSLTVVPDTVIIAGASSNGVSGMGVQVGSTITYDDLAFVGTGITQTIGNSNFDSWTAKSYDEINDWGREGAGVIRTTDKYKGDYAVLIETVDKDNDNNTNYPSAITNGHFEDNVGPVGGVPYTGTQDTLVFYYKYIPSGTDTGSVSISLTANGNPVGGMFKLLAAASSYTRVELPFQTGMTPDSLRIVFASSSFSMQSASLGSKLYIDEVQLKSQPLNTGIFKVVKNNFTVYPNPASTHVTIKLGNTIQNGQIVVSDMLGKQMGNFTIYNTDEISLPVEQLEKGVYTYQVVTDGTIMAAGKFYKQ